MNHQRTALSLLVLTAAGLAGCATTEQPPGKVVDASQYEWVTPLGSNIPVRVLKGSAPATASPSATISGDAAQNMMHGAGGQAMVDKAGNGR